MQNRFCQGGEPARVSQLDRTFSAPMTGSSKTITGRNRLAALLSHVGDLNSGSPVEIWESLKCHVSE